MQVLHPETEKSHSHGLTLENHSEFDHKVLGGHGYDLGHAGSENVPQDTYTHHEYEQAYHHEIDGDDNWVKTKVFC